MSVVGAFYVLCKRDGTVYDDACKYIANPDYVDDANFLSQEKNGEGKRDKGGRGKGG